MKVITYVNGILTVINGDASYSKVDTKPSFISGENFYYEPTLKMMDGVKLTSELEEQADVFVENFVFPPIYIPPEPVHCVDDDGNYLGLIVNKEGHTEVPTAPQADMEKWDGSTWVDSVMIDKNTKGYVGVGDTRNNPMCEYAPNTFTSDGFSRESYSYIDGQWFIPLASAKKQRKLAIKVLQASELFSVIGTLAEQEAASFTIQEKEARAWIADNTTATPFIDGLLSARANGETKEELCNKIIIKAGMYASVYSTQVGRFQKLIKQIDACTTVDEVKLVTW